MENNTVKDTLSSFRMPSYREIPDVGLYLDQVVKYINSCFSAFPEMKITSSMVSNYVKMKIISSPHKKTYSRDQIAALLFIVIGKTVLSMDHIRICLAMKDRFTTNEEAYTAFADRLKEVLSHMEDGRVLSPAGSSEEEKALDHIVITAAHKMFLERYFENIETKQKEKEALAKEKKERTA